MMKPIKSIYVAGKMQDDEWRRELFDPYPRSDSDHARQLGYNPVTVMPETSWPASTDPKTSDPYSGDYGTGLICGLAYTGPFFVDMCGHGYYSEGEDEHGSNISHADVYTHHGARLFDKREQVKQLCLQAIARADLVFAWIDCTDCYGTIAEIGYARALGKVIWIAGPKQYTDLWFVYHMADEMVFASWRSEWDANLKRYPNASPLNLFQELFQDYRRYHRQFDSPIEQAFWDEWLAVTNNRTFQLEPQYSIGKYRVDFAHVETKTAIELDGHATHSSPDAIAYDRQRQRYIESQGWHVIRFGGKEVYSHVGRCVDEVGMLLKKRISTN